MSNSLDAKETDAGTTNPSLSRYAAPVLLLAVGCLLAVDAARRLRDFPGAPPSVIIMGCRVDGLAGALRAYQQTGVPLVSSKAEGQYEPAGFSDDIGSYLYIPLLADALRLDAAVAAEFCYTTIIWLSLVAGAAGWCLYCRTWLTRAATIAMLSSWGLRLAGQSDVYVITPAVIAAAVPWILWLSRRGKADAWLFALGAGLAAVACAANFNRSHGGTPVLIFAAMVFLFHQGLSRKAKAGIALAGILGFATPAALHNFAAAQRDDFLVDGGYRTAEQLESFSGEHPLWHSVYIGLGFVQNSFGISYNDAVALNRVREIGGEKVGYLSAEYEQILRSECFRILKADPRFVLACYVSKARVLLSDFVKIGHLCLLLALLAPVSRRITVAFCITIAFCALPAILAVPIPPYLLGFWAMASLFAAATLEQIVSPAIDRLGAQKHGLRTIAASTATGLLISVALFNSLNLGLSMQSRVATAWNTQRQSTTATAKAGNRSPVATARR